MEYQTEAVDGLAQDGLEVGEKKKAPKAKAVAKPVVVEAPAVFDIVGELKTVLTERDRLRTETAKLKAWLKEIEALEKQIKDVLNKGGSLFRG